jgi:hypothetical protein
MDTFTLAQGWQKGAIPATTLERHARGDKWHEGFRVINPPNFSKDGVFVEQKWRFPIGVWKEKETAKKSTWLKGLAWKRNHQTGNHHKGVVRVDCESMNRCIDLRSTIANSYAQSNNSTSEQKFLIITSIQSWLRAAVRKFKSDVVPSEIWLGLKYQRGRGLPHISNSIYLPPSAQRFRHYDFL